ncbi:hypothetical protein CYMTET_51375 [Cymbomonas tetramitiformis]|uniref:Uncharacterized protein n=1 Tax=Cymbomonas tetramitiformis TaxID=36881 RepID=A0AAE0BL72_9CHLO|nr:hypothetical protein CYMTET_51375 [Cymbomonas tetramitiformis]
MPNVTEITEDCQCDISQQYGTRWPFPVEGFVRSLEDGHLDLMLECPRKKACAGAPGVYDLQTNELTYGDCKVGYTGRLCGVCESRYYNVDGWCYQCHSQQISNVFIFLLVLMACAFIGYALLTCHTFFKCGAMSILLDLLQTQSLFLSFELNWPDEIRGFLQFLKLFNLDIDYFGVSCRYQLSTWYQQYLIYTICNGMWVLVVFGALIVLHRIRYIQGYISAVSAAEAQLDCINATLFIYSILYTRLMTQSLSIFHCRSLGDGSTYLVADTTLKCYTEEWWEHAVPGGVMVFVYCLGIPLAFFLILYRSRRQLMNPLVRRQCGMLYIMYTEEVYYWECVFKMKKLFVTVCMVAFADSTSFQVMAACASLLVFCWLANRYQPFKFVYNNKVLFYTALANYSSLASGLFFWNAAIPDNRRPIITQTWMVSISLCLVSVVHAVVFEVMSYLGPELYEHAPLWFKKFLDSNMMQFSFQLRDAVHSQSHWGLTDSRIAWVVDQGIRESRSRVSHDYAVSNALQKVEEAEQQRRRQESEEEFKNHRIKRVSSWKKLQEKNTMIKTLVALAKPGKRSTMSEFYAAANAVAGEFECEVERLRHWSRPLDKLSPEQLKLFKDFLTYELPDKGASIVYDVLEDWKVVTKLNGGYAKLDKAIQEILQHIWLKHKMYDGPGETQSRKSKIPIAMRRNSFIAPERQLLASQSGLSEMYSGDIIREEEYEEESVRWATVDHLAGACGSAAVVDVDAQIPGLATESNVVSDVET